MIAAAFVIDIHYTHIHTYIFITIYTVSYIILLSEYAVFLITDGRIYYC